MLKKVGILITNILILIVIFFNILILGYIGWVIGKKVMQHREAEPSPLGRVESVSVPQEDELEGFSEQTELIGTDDLERQYEIVAAFDQTWPEVEKTIDAALPDEERMRQITAGVSARVMEQFQVASEELNKLLQQSEEIYAQMAQMRDEAQEEAPVMTDKEPVDDLERQYEIVAAFDQTWAEVEKTIDPAVSEEERIGMLSKTVSTQVIERFQISGEELNTLLQKSDEIYARMAEKKIITDQEIVDLFNKKYESHEQEDSADTKELSDRERKEYLRQRAIKNTAQELNMEEERISKIVGM